MDKLNINAKAFGIAALAYILVLGSSGSLQAQRNGPASDRGLQGTWWVTVTLYDCITHQERPPFVSLLAFAQGGTMTETTANAAFQVGQRSTGFGTWAHLTDRTYTSIDDAFILFTAGPFTQGTQRIDHSITVSLHGNQFNDDATVQFFDTNGNLIGTGCARAAGTRLQ